MGDPAEGFKEVVQMCLAFVTPYVLRAAIVLQIPNILSRAGKPLSINEIAAEIDSDIRPRLDILYRMLSFLAHRKVLKESDDKKYELTVISKWLVTENNPTSFTPYFLLHMYPRCQAVWQRFPDVSLQGGDAFAAANGVDLWECGKDDPVLNQLVNDGMIGYSSHAITVIVEHYKGFQNVNKLVDVGGGVGTSISKIVASNPHIQGINFDLPHVIATAQEIPGVKHVGGDMFDSIPSTDAIIIKSVLHDWGDEKCLQILKNCYSALCDEGKLIIVEIVFDPMDEEAHNVGDIDMILAAFFPGGKQRTRAEWIKILTDEGFSKVSFITLPIQQTIIEAYK